MKTIISAIVGLIALFYPYSARADTNPPIPDVSGWNIVNMSRIELIISSTSVAYIGLETEYNNPKDLRVFVQIVRRHRPCIVSKQKPANERLFSEAVVGFYAQKEEGDCLRENSKKSDPIFYMQWRTKENPRTGKDTLDGDVNIGFMPADGKWLFVKNDKMAVRFLTENIGNGKQHNIFSGMKYNVAGAYHVIRVDRNDIVKLFEVGK